MHLGLIATSTPAPEPATDVALAHELLRRAGAGTAPPLLRLSRPGRPTIAFSRRDTLSAGFPAAVGAARAAGFTPVIRAPGGRAVAFTTRALVVDHVAPDRDAISGLDDRFRSFGGLWAEVLRGLGVDARVGEVPGEYCPGSHSVNARGVEKLVGTAQKVVGGAWLFSAVAILDDADVLRPLLDEVYRALDLPFDPVSVGALAREAPGLTVERLEAALLDGYRSRYPLAPVALDPAALAGARDRLPGHRCTGGELDAKC